MRLKLAALLLLIHAASFGALNAQTSPPPTAGARADDIGVVVDRAARKYMSDARAVGLSVGVLKDGRTYTFNYGEVEKGKRQLPTQHTIYEVGSITKTFTGVLLARAVVEGKVKLEDDVRKYLDGEYPDLEFEGQPVRLVHLINHTSQLPFVLPDRPELFKDPNPYELPKILTEIERKYTREDFYRDLRKVRLDKAPGSKFKYSNAAAQLLGYVLERVYRTTYERLLGTKITNHLKMRETKISLSAAETKRLARGHYENGSVALPGTPQSQAAGGLRSTVADMLKYVRFHLNERDEVVALSHRPTWGDIKYYASGLNWQMNMTAGGRRRLWQSGGTFGFASHCAVFPELGLGIVLMSNESDHDTQSRLDTLAKEVLEGLGEKP
ncbi:MAG: serine hydrolase domain-containing protein [Pyrinomonadaceae bacterium]